MAFFPCSSHHAPYRGPSHAAYPAIVTGREAERGKLRLCEPCFDDYILVASDALVEVVDEASAGATPTCWACDAPCIDGDCSSIFVTAYPRGHEPRNFYGRSCADHREASAGTFLLK